MSVRLARLSPGNPGIRETIQRFIWPLMLGWDPEHAFGQTLERLRFRAEAILREKNAVFSPDSFQAGAVYAWVQEHVGYVRDHLLFEDVHAPWKVLDAVDAYGNAMGDCDDFVILMGALWAAIGIPFHLVAVSARPDREFAHVFLVADTQDGPIVADAITGEAFGWHVPGYDPATGNYQLPVTNVERFETPGWPELEALGINPLAGVLQT